jgi:glycosyltransferase involved in cell wall biosynthesis
MLLFASDSSILKEVWPTAASRALASGQNLTEPMQAKGIASCESASQSKLKMNTDTSKQYQSSNPKQVSIGVPIYRRLEYLPSVLKMVGSQDYPAIELIISDNGQNGTKVREIVEAQYHRPYRFRQNPSTVDVTQHHNQIIREASGEYFHLLSDDDEISPNFVSELVKQLERHPEATLAYARLEIINNDGIVVRKSKENLPLTLSGPDFVRAIWQSNEFGFYNIEGFLTQTRLWKDAGGYPNFIKGNFTDNAVVIKLCLNHHVVFSSECAYRHRVHPEGLGWTASMKELAAASREFLRWLDDDPTIQQFAAANFNQWQDLKQVLVRMTWWTYLWRWRDIYQHKLSAAHWAREAFRMPFIPAYYRRVASIFRDTAKARVKRLLANQPEDQRDFFQGARKSSNTHIGG